MSFGYTCSSSSSFDTYGGKFPDGYCVWELGGPMGPVLISCHCRPTYVCGAPPGDMSAAARPPGGVFTYRVKIRCVPPS